jgi:predicted DNA repair protein MutK
MLGGAYLCYEGIEKIFHQKKGSHITPAAKGPEIETEVVRIRGAIRTDFVLSAEIIVISLGTVKDSVFSVHAGVLSAVALGMTVGVYGLVAGIVKIDDLGLRLLGSAKGNRAKILLGTGLLKLAPKLMHGLSRVETVAMFLVGGGILAHASPTLAEWLSEAHGVLEFLVNGVVGFVGGVICYAALHLLKGLPARLRSSTRI